MPAAFSSAAVARRVGVTDRTMWRWEHGLNRPHARHARALAKELGVALADLQLDEAKPEDHDEGQATS